MSIRREINAVHDPYHHHCHYVPPSQKANRTQMTIEDDFKLIYTFSDKRYSPPELIDLRTFDLLMQFYIEGKESVIYEAEMLSGQSKNCVIDYCSSSIKVLFQDHKLGAGDLYGKFIYTYWDLDFPTKRASVTKLVDTNVTLTEI